MIVGGDLGIRGKYRLDVCLDNYKEEEWKDMRLEVLGWGGESKIIHLHLLPSTGLLRVILLRALLVVVLILPSHENGAECGRTVSRIGEGTVLRTQAR